MDDADETRVGAPEQSEQEPEADVEGHSFAATHLVSALNRPRVAGAAPNPRRRAEPELPPLTRKFPRMRDEKRG